MRQNISKFILLIIIVQPKFQKMHKHQQEFPRSFTNQVLCQKGKKEQATFYVPGYLRIKVKNFNEIDLQSLKAQINATLIFTVYYGSLPQIIVGHLVNHLVLHFGRDDAMKLNKENLQITLKQKQKSKQFTYTVRKIFKTRIDCDVFWSPFQLVNLILSITLQSVSYKIMDEQNKKILAGQIKFNLMDHQSRFMKASYSEQGRFGNYDLAEALMQTQYSNDRITKQMKEQIEAQKKQRERRRRKKNIQSNKKTEKEHPQIKENIKKSNKPKQLTLKQQIPKLLKRTVQDVMDYSKILTGSSINKTKSTVSLSSKQDNKIKHFQYAHFTIPLYRLPISAIVTIFLPLWLLGIINLGIFFQGNDLGGRIASIATMMIAFMSLIATIREQIPPSPKITLVELLVYMQTFTSFLGFVHSLNIRNLKKFTFHWYSDTLYMLSLLITILNVLIVVILYTNHKLIWEPSYNRYEDQEDSFKFEPEKWRNQECDFHFQKHKNKFLTIEELEESEQKLMKLIKTNKVRIEEIK